MKVKLLICTEYFKPGVKAGGIIEASYNLAVGLSKQVEVFVLTSDRDLHSKAPYSNTKLNEWLEAELGYKVMYLQRGRSIFKVINELNPSAIFLNGLFSFKYNILPLFIKVFNLTKAKIVLSPRGMLKSTALKFKSVKKKLFISFLNIIKIKNQITFHGTDENEVIEIKNAFGNDVNVFKIFDIALEKNIVNYKLIKKTGELNCIFVGRVHPIKNILFFIDILKQVKAKINFTIAGPIEDYKYWELCQQSINEVGSNIKFHYIGNITNNQVIENIHKNHILINTSYGENFGYSIIEALQSSRPVLISDNTPWTNLELYRAGWSLPLSSPDLFVNALNISSNWSQEEFNQHCISAKSYIDNKLNSIKIIQEYLELFK